MGATVCGTLLTLFRAKIRPTFMIVLLMIVGFLGQVTMIYPEYFDDAMKLAVASASFVEGALMVTLASFVHEEYGTENFGLLYGTFLTFGAAGLYANDEVFFPNLVDWYSEENAVGVKYFKAYGKWNVFLFSCLSGLYFLSILLAAISHYSIKKREEAEGQKLVMVKF